MNIKPIKAFAIVKKDKPKFDVFEIYKDGDVMLNEGEILIEVLISPLNNIIIKGKGKPVTLKK